ncbi:MAG: GNAT family N-acetyltransferase [Rubrivivax sp.]|nr:GNAT family N-acetyltransferase [Rubrivivax sp.]
MEPPLRLAALSEDAAVAEILIESRRRFLPFAPMRHPPAEVQAWVGQQLLPTGRVVVVEVAAKLVAVLATSEQEKCSWIDQLYVLTGYTSRGLGTRLLQHAHQTLRPPIRPYTFQANLGARRFYERHGYHAVEFTDGSANEEQCPDVLYELQASRAEA